MRIKKLTALLLTATMIISLSGIGVVSNAATSISADLGFNTRDALNVLRAATNALTLTAEQAARYDLNGDGEVSVADALLILRAVVGQSENTENIDSNAEIEQSAAYYHDDEYVLTLHTDKTVYAPAEEIIIWAAFEYIGDKKSVEIFHSSEYLTFTIVNQDGVYFNEGIVNDIGLTSVLEKGEIYRHGFKKSGSWDPNAPDAGYWSEFYNTDRLFLPVGEYKITASVNFFALDEWQNFNVELSIKVVAPRYVSVLCMNREYKITASVNFFALDEWQNLTSNFR